MRAALLDAQQHMTMIDADMPAVQHPDDVLIRVKTVGICGSEVHAFYGTHPFRKAPAVLGHEAAGDVIAVGSAVTHFKPGDRVVVDPQWTCGKCEYCLRGDINLCPSKKVLGTQVWPGAFGEYIVVPEETAFLLPDNLSYAQGSLIEPLTIGVHVSRRANIQPGQSVAILGTGSIGGMISGVCRASGAATIITADIHQHCLDAARERLGATHDFLLPDSSFADKVLALTGGQGVDAVFIAADEPTLVNTAIQILKRRGRIVLVALLTEGNLDFSAYPLIAKEGEILGSLMTNQGDVQHAIDLAASGQVDVLGIATHTLPIEQAQRGMEMVHTKDDGAIKVLLNF
jgi:L-iditol 2-dehydrogenase